MTPTMIIEIVFIVAFFALMMVVTNVKPLKKLHPLVFIAFAAAVGILIGYTIGWGAA